MPARPPSVAARAWGVLRRNLIEPFVRAQGSPESLARGAALGTWLTLTPTVGIQMTLAAVAGLPLKANLPVAIALIWLSNPVTIVPMYYGYYWLGAVLLGRDTRGYGELARDFKHQFDLIESQGFLQSLRNLGDEVLWPMTLGSLVLATALAVPAYFGVRAWALRRAARRAREQAAAAAVQGAAPAPALPGAAPGEAR